MFNMYLQNLLNDMAMYKYSQFRPRTSVQVRATPIHNNKTQAKVSQYYTTKHTNIDSTNHKNGFGTPAKITKQHLTKSSDISHRLQTIWGNAHKPLSLKPFVRLTRSIVMKRDFPRLFLFHFFKSKRGITKRTDADTTLSELGVNPV